MFSSKRLVLLVWATALATAASEAPLTCRQKAEAARAAVERLETTKPSAAERKKLAAEARAHCADVQLGAIDLWYADSIVTWARLMMLEGDWRPARETLLDQAETLQKIERNLAANDIPVSSMSPVAGGRFILAETYWIEHEETNALEPAIAAFKHYYNVHVKYGDGVWGPCAGEKAATARALIESRGKRVRIDLGPHRAAYVATKFKLGARMVAEEQFAAAVDPLEAALNVFPESSASVRGLRALGVAFVHLGDKAKALATVEYLGERFAANTNAPAAGVAIGRAFLNTGNERAGEQAFDLYLAAFPDDSHRSDILSFLAWRAYMEEDWPASVARFAALEAEFRKRGVGDERLEKAVYIQATHPADAAKLGAFLKEFPRSDLAPSALGKKAEALLIAGEFDAAFQTLSELGAHYPAAPEAAGALGGLICAAVEAERYDVAERVLERMLEDQAAYRAETYLATGERLLASGRPSLALKAFEALPPDDARGMYGIGRARFAEERWEEGVAAMDDLLKKHPKTRFFRNAQLARARALVKLERKGDAAAAYGDVLALAPDLGVSLELADITGDREERLAAYQRVALLADPDDDKNLPAIERGLLASLPLCAELDKHQLLVKNCDQFDQMFPGHDQSPVVAAYRKEAERALAR